MRGVLFSIGCMACAVGDAVGGNYFGSAVIFSGITGWLVARHYVRPHRQVWAPSKSH
ncbi:MAG: hypothetical protein JWR52_1100 [Marmoricola sp.]|nr:hypothetical protein [Marmoricola sp.]